MNKRKRTSLVLFWAFMLSILAYTRCSAQGYADIGAGFTKQELTFHGGSTYIAAKHFALRGQYFFSTETELFSLSMGPVVYYARNLKTMVFFGTELNNEFEPKISALTWVRVTDDIYAQLAAESAGKRMYVSLGIVVELVKGGVRKEKRFF